MRLDAVAYALKTRHPAIFSVLDWTSGVLTILRHGLPARRATMEGRLSLIVSGQERLIHALRPADVDALSQFFAVQHAESFTFFRPHGFNSRDLMRVVKSQTTLAYGLSLGGAIKGYGLIKLFPTRNAYCGLFLDSSLRGQGFGKFLWKYLIWQCELIGVTACATIHPDNMSSVASLRAVQPAIRLYDLPNGYKRVEIPANGLNRPPEIPY